MSDEKKFGGPKEFFLKISCSKFFFPKILVRKKKKIFLFQKKKFKTNHVINVKFEFRMISAFI